MRHINWQKTGREEVKAKPRKRKPPAEEVKKKVKEKVPGLTDREKTILSIIRDNPEGITLPEIAYIMGVAFVTITKDLARLLKEGLIKKEENRYFPV